MAMAVEKKSAGAKEHYRKDERSFLPEMSLEEIISFNCGDKYDRPTYYLDVCAHFHEWQSICRQIQRICYAIVGEVVDILSSADLQCKIRKKIMCFVEAQSEIFRNSEMLAFPVNIGTPYKAICS